MAGLLVLSLCIQQAGFQKFTSIMFQIYVDSFIYKEYTDFKFEAI